METAKSQKKHMDELHSEHKEWMNRLQFVIDEINTFKSRLEEVASKYTSNEIGAMVEQYQNQFIRQNEVIDQHLHDIKIHENKLVEDAKQNIIASDRRLFDDHDDLRGKMDDFDRIYKDLKQKYFRFLAENL